MAKKPAKERLHSQAGFSTLLPKIVAASGLGALPCLVRDMFLLWRILKAGYKLGYANAKNP